jgi:argininosuccinate lyase
MNAACIRDFSTATELADMIVREKNLPFRTAHQIVGALVSKALDDGLAPSEVNSAFLDKAAISVTGEKLALSDEVVTAALTPLLAVKARRGSGGPAPETVTLTTANLFDRLAHIEQSLSTREAALNKSQKKLLKAVDSILGA